MLLVAKVKSSGSTIPEGTILQLDVELPQAVGAGTGTAGAQPGSQRLTIQAMAARYDVCVKTVERWVEKNLVPYFRIGSNVYFKESELDAMEQRCSTPARILTTNQIPLAIRQHAERKAA